MRTKLGWVSALLVGALALGGCGGGGGGGGGKAGLGKVEYRFALSSPIKGFDPINANDVPTARVLGAVHETLLQYHYLERPFRVVPNLAKAMPEVSEGGKVYTFQLQEGVLFHDDEAFGGKPRELVAEDFVYAWKRLADPRLSANGWWVLESWVEGLDEWRAAIAQVAKDLKDEPAAKVKAAEQAAFEKPVSGLQAQGKHSLVVRLKRPYPQFPYILTMVYTAPMAREVAEHYGEELRQHGVGTGAFRVRSYRPGAKIVLVKNETFRDERYPSTGSQWAKDNGMLADAGKKLPFLDKIEYEIIKESQPAWLKFLAGELDRNGIPKDSFDNAISAGNLSADLVKKGVKLQTYPSQTLWWVGFNLKDPVFQGEKGLHLRRAIAYSHDAAKFIKVLYNGRGQPSDAIIPPHLAAYDKSKLEYDYSHSLEKAREELALAGYPEGKGAPKLRIDTRGEGSVSRQVSEFLLKGLNDIGLEAEIIGNTFQQFLQKARDGHTQIYWGGWVGDYPDEENWLQLLYGKNADGGTNYSHYKNPEFDALYEKTREMPDSPERRALIQKAINLALRDVPWRMSFVQTDWVLHHRWLKNFYYGDVIYNWQKYLRIDQVDRAKGL